MNNRKNTITNNLTTALSIIYLIALFWILLFKLGVRFFYMGNRNVNLIPFSEFFNSKAKIDVSELILNIVVFVPLGIYAGVLFKGRTFVKYLFIFFLSSLIVEGLQFILRVGIFDITDIITNTLGGIIGLMIFKAIEKIFNNGVKAQIFINIIAAIGTVLMISLLLLLKMNMLLVRYQ
ncbi:VanZ family protein [Flavihumibacter profundi]|uniref:VanZ family protein n=1 Tax=Flavihumibacter profundi TaxID=2716883 RepID=UPI001CC768B9|nr:VanZ family protein [Flavihumibacter profundi]MBZ5858136.1 VanZ family protein [Flavihumibacter profundi]